MSLSEYYLQREVLHIFYLGSGAVAPAGCGAEPHEENLDNFGVYKGQGEFLGTFVLTQPLDHTLHCTQSKPY